MDLQTLVLQHNVKRALIIDDAYDLVPEAEDLKGLPTGPMVSALQLESLEIKQILGPTLEALGLEEDEFEDGLSEDDFVSHLWQLAEAGTLSTSSANALFQNYRAEQEQKRKQLLPLEALLKDELHLPFETQGRETDGQPQCDLLFLDLYLGVTDDDAALQQAISRVKRLVETLGDEARPLVVVMSTKAGGELSTLASRLQADASLLGCKFRTVSKPEFEKVLRPLLGQMLTEHQNAQVVAKWLDTWKSAITNANNTFINKLRSLDLADYAYLQKYRLEAEGVDMGAYLRPTLLDFLSYCVEEDAELSKQASQLDVLTFAQAPSAHLLPSERVTELAHARTFLNRTVIEVEGFQVDDVSKQLNLGDVIIKKPADAIDYDFDLHGREASVIITQACDIQQDKTDAFLMLKGTIHRRDWTADLIPSDSRTDVFMWNGVDYSLDWEQAKVGSVKKSTMKDRLKPNGGFARIARFRDVEALRIQSLFARNLTRFGMAVGFHHVSEAGIELWVRAENQPMKLYGATVEQKMAALVFGRAVKASGDGPGTRKSDYRKVLIFGRMFPDQLADALKVADFSGVDTQQAALLKAFANSTEDLKTLHSEHLVSKAISFGKDIKVSVALSKLPDDWNGRPTLVVKARNLLQA